MVAVIWSLKQQEPDEFARILPFPGEFHFLMHITHGLYRLFGAMLLTLAKLLNRSKIQVDFHSAYWHKQEDFLLIVIHGILQLSLQVTNKPANLTAVETLQEVQYNDTTSYVLHFLYQ